VGSLSADLLLCDSGSRVLAVIDIRNAEETERSRRRHERMARVLRAARIPVYEWREGQLPPPAKPAALSPRCWGRPRQASSPRPHGRCP